MVYTVLFASMAGAGSVLTGQPTRGTPSTLPAAHSCPLHAPAVSNHGSQQQPRHHR